MLSSSFLVHVVTLLQSLPSFSAQYSPSGAWQSPATLVRGPHSPLYELVPYLDLWPPLALLLLFLLQLLVLLLNEGNESVTASLQLLHKPHSTVIISC